MAIEAVLCLQADLNWDPNNINATKYITNLSISKPKDNET